MTLIVTIPANDGVVIGSDMQVTAGSIRYTDFKIKELNSHCLWAASGDVPLIQRVEECISSFDADASLIDLRDGISIQIRDCIYNLWQLDIRSRTSQNESNDILESFNGEFIFTEYRDKPITLHYFLTATSMKVFRYDAIGIGAPFAYALLRKYENLDFNTEMASITVYKVLDEAIRVGSYGLGHPIDLWKIDTNGIHQFTKDEMDIIYGKAGDLIKSEVELLKTVISKKD